MVGRLSARARGPWRLRNDRADACVRGHVSGRAREYGYECVHGHARGYVRGHLARYSSFRCGVPSKTAG